MISSKIVARKTINSTSSLTTSWQKWGRRRQRLQTHLILLTQTSQSILLLMQGKLLNMRKKQLKATHMNTIKMSRLPNWKNSLRCVTTLLTLRRVFTRSSSCFWRPNRITVVQNNSHPLTFTPLPLMLPQVRSAMLKILKTSPCRLVSALELALFTSNACLSQRTRRLHFCPGHKLPTLKCFISSANFKVVSKAMTTSLENLGSWLAKKRISSWRIC